MWGTPLRPIFPLRWRRFIPTHVGNTPGPPALCRGRTVHPHACGEHSAIAGRTVDARGSSPRMWGTRAPGAGASAHPRFIPTHVGNTTGDRQAPVGIGGSSPRMWGTRIQQRTANAPVRFIPTHVGNTRISAAVGLKSRGSSPRMWGTLVLRQTMHCCRRFIPTHVGNTVAGRRPCSAQAVHPHACGEHDAARDSDASGCGSSPRMWGTHPGATVAALIGRFIPTHVGNTLSGSQRGRQSTVHPHACGEHRRVDGNIAIPTGSSPRMWGTRKVQRLDARQSRFIPTHVGNTVAGRRPCSAQAVHPHACGEHTLAHAARNSDHGSSPRMWGTHVGRHGPMHLARFIPTHVGNTLVRPPQSEWRSVHPHACGEHRPLSD